MKSSAPNTDTRASARAAALSDAISMRCSRSPVVIRCPDSRRVVNARRTSLVWITTSSNGSGPVSRKTSAVIILVRLAIDRWSSAPFSQSTSPVSGL